MLKQETLFDVGATTIDGKKKVKIDGKRVLLSHKRLWQIKRAQDIIFSFVALVLLLPVFALVALAIVIESPGASPIFKQERVGRKGKLFTMYKFRSMYPDAEAKRKYLLHQNEMDGPVFKIKEDPRITRVGKFIRKCSIDELPQFYNVLRGDMSIVGPRPALPHEVEAYNEYELQRLLVTPGLTCFWQIAPHRNELSFEEWMDLDIKYILQRSIGVDWMIMLKTVHVCLFGHGE